MYAILARRALRAALEVRKKVQVPLTSPLCIYDVAEKLKVEVRFHGGASFGGMYAKETQTVLVPSERPAGRRAFTCAHELGHWYFKHGTRVEELGESDGAEASDPDEALVNQFAGHLLMAKPAIQLAFKKRQLAPSTSTQQELYAIACQFGVGYNTIITHLCYALELIPRRRAEELLRSSAKATKESLLYQTFANHLVLVDESWDSQMPIDLEVGDRVLTLFPSRAEGDRLAAEPHTGGGTILEAIKPGLARILSVKDSWVAFVRISKRGFTGRSIYRHLEDPDE